MPDTVLFIHSTAAGPFMWGPYQPTLPAGLRPVLPVNRGYARDDLFTLGQPFTVDDEATHLLSHVPADAEGVHIVAHSYGALAGLTLARQSGVKVRSMWLYEPVLFASLRREMDTLPADAAQEISILSGETGSLLDPSWAGTEAWIERFIDYWNGTGGWARVPEKAKAMTRLVAAKMFAEVQMVSRDPLPFADYAFAEVPMTLVRGEATTAAARTMLDRLAQVNPHAHVDVLPRAGHMGVLNSPQAVESLTAHWARVRGE